MEQLAKSRNEGGVDVQPVIEERNLNDELNEVHDQDEDWDGVQVQDDVQNKVQCGVQDDVRVQGEDRCDVPKYDKSMKCMLNQKKTRVCQSSAKCGQASKVQQVQKELPTNCQPLASWRWVAQRE